MWVRGPRADPASLLLPSSGRGCPVCAGGGVRSDTVAVLEGNQAQNRVPACSMRQSLGLARNMRTLAGTHVAGSYLCSELSVGWSRGGEGRAAVCSLMPRSP